MQALHVLMDEGYEVSTIEADRFNRYRFVLSRNGELVGRGTHFTGGRHISPWIELQPATVFNPENQQDRALFNQLTALLEPGSHLMIHYLQDGETARAITENVPPPATPLGFLLWEAGVRWFKDWYFTEGWMEGDQKLQGNLPLNQEVKREREQEMQEQLEAFLETGMKPRCRERADQVLAGLMD